MVALGEETFDKLFKIRPLITHLQSKFLTFSYSHRKRHILPWTVRTNRSPGCRMLSDTDVKRKGRGAYDKRVYRWKHFPLCFKWFGSKQSPFWPLLKVHSSVKALGQKKHSWCTMLTCWLQPRVQQVHGSSWTLGCGNALIGSYRIKLRSKKYYHRIFFHFLDTVVSNTWLLYLNDCNDVGLQESKH